MQLPESVEIAGLTFRVVTREMEGTYGSMQFDKREIAIVPGLTPIETLATLRHEMMHASLSAAGLSHAEKYDEEPIVRALENIFFPAWDKLTKNDHG